MQTLKLSLSWPNDTHPDMELRVSTNETLCDVVVTLPSARAGISRASSDEPSSAEDHAFGGYAGI
ncbi:hypothetical protein [Rhodanobacter geophilus]|uniref:Uncharacterized protein n=1 Tax=Rhodanobacter geophilus TaxID=3162488 RepID=A0ABV3QR75_9GAMM